jgi:hypothetical protein
MKWTNFSPKTENISVLALAFLYEMFLFFEFITNCTTGSLLSVPGNARWRCASWSNIWSVYWFMSSNVSGNYTFYILRVFTEESFWTDLKIEEKIALIRWYFYTKAHGLVPHKTGRFSEFHLRLFRCYVCVRGMPFCLPSTDLKRSFPLSWIAQDEWSWGVANSRLCGGVTFYCASVMTLISADGCGWEVIPIPRNPKRNFATPTCYCW